MFQRSKTIHGKPYVYVEHSFRIGNTVKKVSFYLPKDVKEFPTLNYESVQRIVQLRVEYIHRHQHYSRFFSYGNQLQTIEYYKIWFKVLFEFLGAEDQAIVLDEFLRLFLVNSMAMEGGTISYQLAQAIDQKKRIRIENINALDIPLYLQLKKAQAQLSSIQLRYPKQIRDLHRTIYLGIYPFAGKFRTKKVTFGDVQGLAITAESEHISVGYKKALQRYYRDKGRIYDFERIVRFHVDFQAVHGFEDGNSRLGRLIMMQQFLRRGYPPFLIRGTQSKAYRRCLVRAINEQDTTSLLKFFYLAYKKTFLKFWLPILEQKVQEALKRRVQRFHR